MIPVLVAEPCLDSTVIAEVSAEDKVIVPEFIMDSVSDDVTEEVRLGDFVFITFCLRLSRFFASELLLLDELLLLLFAFIFLLLFFNPLAA